MGDKCKSCTKPIAVDILICGHCDVQAEYPNVRYAQRLGEKRGLTRRLKKAKEEVAKNGTAAEHAVLMTQVGASALVINRHLSHLRDWLDRNDKLYVNFYRKKAEGVPWTEDEWNMQRIAAESAISPYFFTALNIAAITTTDEGLSYYGAYSIFIREDEIAHRTTVFEENPFYFNRRHKVIAGRMPPSGYRAQWKDRDKLASAKLSKKLKKGMTSAQIDELVMQRQRARANCDFIEAHVYGEIPASAITQVVGPRPVLGGDRQIWNSLKRQLKLLGATVSEMP